VVQGVGGGGVGIHTCIDARAGWKLPEFQGKRRIN
jgi:hypothetical protein